MRCAHIVIGHPYRDSFNGHLARTAAGELEISGWQVSVSDLGAMNFDPAEGLHHYPGIETAGVSQTAPQST